MSDVRHREGVLIKYSKTGGRSNHPDATCHAQSPAGAEYPGDSPYGG